MREANAANANLVLHKLAEAGYHDFFEELDEVQLVRNAKLVHSRGAHPFVWFPLSGLVSILGNFGGTNLEVGVVGRESMLGMRVFFGGARLPVDSIVNVSGKALRLTTDRFSELIWADPQFYALFMPFISAWIRQIAETATANAKFSIRDRVIRRLLMTQDRIGKRELPVTHAGLAVALGVRRPSITVALNDLAEQGLILNARGRIEILQREALTELVGTIYTPMVVSIH